MLLERAAALALLRQARRRADEGGHVAWVAGEAGIGKTTLLRAFAQEQPVPVHWGTCDPLFAPRPLGPLHDMAATLGPGTLQALAQGADRHAVFAAVHTALCQGRPTLIFDDVHWADEATLDLLAWLGRRMVSTQALLLASYRDDELGATHPLRRVFGAVPGTTRVSLARLSVDAVRELAAGSAIDAVALHRASSGNPFFVTEVLAVDGSQRVPPTVRDAVLARLAPLHAAVRGVLEAAAVLGPRIDRDLLQRLTACDPAHLDACLDVGVLQDSDGTLDFRHELGRQVVMETLATHRREDLHRRVLALLRTAPRPDAACLAEHAEAARDPAEVLVWAPQAARQAVALGARRQAFEQYARALRFAAGLDDREHAALLESFALVCLSVGERQAGVDARRRAIALRARLGDVTAQAENLCRLTNLLVGMARDEEAVAALREAFELLRPLPPCRELGYAWRTQAHLSMLHHDDATAIPAARQAVALGEQFGDLETVISALNSLGTAQVQSDYEGGRAVLQRSRQLALEAGRSLQVYNADINLADTAIEAFDFVAALGHLQAADTTASNLQMERVTTLGRLAQCRLHLGQWNEAADLAHLALADHSEMKVNRALAQVVLGRLRARRGDAGVWDVLDEALGVAQTSGQLQYLATVHAARAEAAWLAGDAQRCLAEADAAHALAVEHRHGWYEGELAWWRRRAGASVPDLPFGAHTPYGLMALDRWHEAAAAWQARGCPYERALALAQADPTTDPQALQEALVSFERLSARPAADALRQRLSLRGPRASTRDNPFGLTARELQVLQLLCQGLRNAEIAQRVHRSVRTVDHHLAAVFAKLGVDSRMAAVQAAQRAGLQVQSGQSGAAN